MDLDTKDTKETNRRVLFLTRKWPPAVGGMETYSVEITQALRDLGHEVEITALPGRVDGSAPRAGALLWFGLSKSVRLLLRRDPGDVVMGGDMAIWPLVWAACLGNCARPVLTAHGTDISLASRPGLIGRLYAAYLQVGRRLLPNVRIAANSAATEARVRAAGFAKTGIAPLGCRVSVDAPHPGLERILLFAGRLVERKGLSWFVTEVLPKMPEDILLAVAGTHWDESENSALSDPRVDFLGPLPQEVLWRHMAGALAVVMPNVRKGAHQFEGFGLTASEAAAAGGIVLAAELDGYTTSVVDGETGTLLPPEDSSEWAKAIIAIANLPRDEQVKLRNRAQHAANKCFNWGKTAQKTVELFG